jgi:hypothetical protein
LADESTRHIPSMGILELFFQPPFAIARLGGSDTPLDNFHWATDPGIHAGGRTVIVPAITIDVSPQSGTPSLRLPTKLQFSDRGGLRPVAPFFELWVRCTTARGVKELPLNLSLMEEMRIAPRDVEFRVTVANRKAQRRTGLPSCGYIASATARGNDYETKKLRASSPSDPKNPPLVRPEFPVPLGSFQVVCPVQIAAKPTGMCDTPDLSVMRLRFTPGKGEVYGPRLPTKSADKPVTTASIPSCLPEGQEAPWDRILQGRMHEIVVKPENRILNGEAAFASYLAGVPDETDPQPDDSYDGAKNGSQIALGIIDDVCDGVVEAHLVLGGRRYSAAARVSVGPPDFSPDRRHFVSGADDLADRDCAGIAVTDANLEETEAEIADLLTRVFETASQINLDAERVKFLDSQYRGHQSPQMPATDYRSLTPKDAPYADISAITIPADYAHVDHSTEPRSRLPFTDTAALAHAKLAERHYLLQFLRARFQHVRKLVRPAFKRFHELEAVYDESPDPAGDYSTVDPPRLRDARVDRDGAYDMRMPPFMRDADALPLSLTRRQYDMLIGLLDYYAMPAEGAAPPKNAVIPEKAAPRSGAKARTA